MTIRSTIALCMIFVLLATSCTPPDRITLAVKTPDNVTVSVSGPTKIVHSARDRISRLQDLAAKAQAAYDRNQSAGDGPINQATKESARQHLTQLLEDMSQINQHLRSLSAQTRGLSRVISSYEEFIAKIQP